MGGLIGLARGENDWFSDVSMQQGFSLDLMKYGGLISQFWYVELFGDFAILIEFREI